jgi:SAM-dependent methyltransferase
MESADGAWSSGGSYEPYVGRWSRLVAAEFVDWLDAPPGGTWLDVGCGTGALTEAIVQKAAPSRVMGIDPSAAYVAHAQHQLGGDTVTFAVGDAQELDFADESVDVAVSGLVLNFVPDPVRALNQMKRVVRPGGTVAAYVWDYAGEMWLMRHFWDAAIELDPDARELDEGARFELWQPNGMQRVVADTGLREVETRAIVVPTVFASFDDYWTPFLGAQGPAPTYLQSRSAREQAELREALRARLAADSDGSIALTARAWAIKARRRS